MLETNPLITLQLPNPLIQPCGRTSKRKNKSGHREMFTKSSHDTLIQLCPPNAYKDTIMERSQRDIPVDRIWVEKPTIFIVLLLRVRWGFINSFKKLQQ